MSLSVALSVSWYGRLSVTRCCALRSLEEATSFMALVICMVLCTLLMRSLISFIEAMIYTSFLPSASEAACIFCQRILQAVLDRLIPGARRRDLLHQRLRL